MVSTRKEVEMQKRAGPFGPGIRAVREERGLSLRKLGEMSGLKHQTIHEIEHGTIPKEAGVVGEAARPRRVEDLDRRFDLLPIAF